MTRELDGLVIALFGSPTDDVVYAEASRRREEIVAYLKRPEALDVLDRLPDERSQEQLSLVLTLFADLSEHPMAGNAALAKERDNVESKLCDAFDQVLLHNLPYELRNLGRRLEQAGANKIDRADLEYLLEEPGVARALGKDPSWRGWEEWAVTPLSLYSAMQAISLLAQNRSQGFSDVVLLSTKESFAKQTPQQENAIVQPEEAATAIIRATHWSPEVAAVAYDWLLGVAQYVPRLFEHFRIEDAQHADIVLVPSTVDRASRTDPDRFTKRWQAAGAEESRAVFLGAGNMDPAKIAYKQPLSRQPHPVGLQEDAAVFIVEKSYLDRGWIFLKTHYFARNALITCALVIALVVVLGNLSIANLGHAVLSVALNLVWSVSESVLTIFQSP